MTLRTRPCFLIDSLLEEKEKITTTEEEESQEDVAEPSRSEPTASSPQASSSSLDSEGEEETEPTQLAQLISNMIDARQDTGRSTQDHHQPVQQQQKTLMIPSPLEYLSKLHLMQQAALHFSTLAAMRPPSMPVPPPPQYRKVPDVLFPNRGLPLMRTVRSSDAPRGNAKKYRCDVCDKTFSRSNTLITHKRIHTGEKPFQCDHCGRAFRQPGNLTRHRLTHTTVKPYVCAHCDKAFNRASNLHTHMRTHSGK